jgi:hypothetical protein
MKGRSIHDNYKLVRESAIFLNKKKCPSILLKLDIAKAFDTVACQFLLEVLQKKGFSHWRAWISLILASSSTSILLSGTRRPKFWHARCLRQGDALSPMLFILVMDALNLLFEKAEIDGVISAFPPH